MILIWTELRESVEIPIGCTPRGIRRKGERPDKLVMSLYEYEEILKNPNLGKGYLYRAMYATLAPTRTSDDFIVY